MAKKIKNKFAVVNPKWIIKQLDEKELTRQDLQKGINAPSVEQVHNWLNGYRNLSRAAKAAVYYYFTYGYKEK